MSDENETVRKEPKEIEQLIDALRQELVKRSVKLFREYLAPDAIILALDDPRIYKGKDECLEYIRLVEQRTDLEKLEASIEDLKIAGDAAVVLERASTQYVVRGQTFHDTARTTWVLLRQGGPWRVTHIHLESLAPTRVVGKGE